MDDGGTRPPYWQLPATVTHRGRSSSSSSSAFLNSSLAIILLPSLAMLLILIAIPSFSTFTFQPSPQPAPAKITGWGTLHVLLALLAISGAVFLRRNHEQHSPKGTNHNRETFCNNRAELMQNLFGCSAADNMQTRPVVAASLTRRNRNMTHQGLWEPAATSERLRLFDDFDLDRLYPLPTSNCVHRAGEGLPVGGIPAGDTFVLRSAPPNLPLAIPQGSGRACGVDHSWMETAAAPNLPPPATGREAEGPADEEEKMRRKECKKQGYATKEIASTIPSLYIRRKKMRNHKIRHDYESSVQPFPSQYSAPPPSVFHSLLKLGIRSKKIHSPSTAPPRPQTAHTQPETLSPDPSSRSPSPPPSIISRTAPRNRASIKAENPPLPERSNDLYESDEDVVQPPAYTMTKPEHAWHRGYDRVREEHGSPPDDEEDSSDPDEINGGNDNGPYSGWRPSPDVNAKAALFIARHHDGWRLEKLNSWGIGDTSWP